MRGGGGPTLIHGGAGHDDLLAGSGNDQLFGDDGDDFFMGRAGNDTYDGGPGDDRIGIPKSSTSTDDDQGNDDYRGGPGSDLLELAAHAAGMTITIDEAANDGSAGETDNVHNDIEVIRGTGKNDVFTGSAGPDRFEGNGDSDTIHGGGGDDLLFGGGGDDQVLGDTGNDKIEGTNGADTLDGGPGTDQIYGDIGNCSAFCNFDADVLLARDGERDVVDCGGGADSAQVDQLDVVAFCSTIDRQTTGPAGSPSPVSGAPPNGASAVFTLVVAPRPRISKGVRVTLTCPAACSYAMSVVLSSKTARKLKLGRKALSVGTVRGGMLAGSKKLTVRLSPKSKRKLGRARRVEARLKAVVKDSAGKSSTQTKSITLGR